MSDFTAEFELTYSNGGSLDAAARAAKERLESVTAEPTVSPMIDTGTVVADLENDLGDLTATVNADVAGTGVGDKPGAGGGRGTPVAAAGVGGGRDTFTAAAGGDSELVNLAEREVKLLDEIVDSLGQSAFDAARRGGGGGGGGGGLLGAGRLAAAGGGGLLGVGGGLLAGIGVSVGGLGAMLGDRLTEDGGEVDLTNLLYGAVDNEDSFLNQADAGAEGGYRDGEPLSNFVARRFEQRGGDEIQNFAAEVSNTDFEAAAEKAAKNAADEISSISLDVDDSRLPDFMTGDGNDTFTIKPDEDLENITAEPSKELKNLSAQIESTKEIEPAEQGSQNDDSETSLETVVDAIKTTRNKTATGTATGTKTGTETGLKNTTPSVTEQIKSLGNRRESTQQVEAAAEVSETNNVSVNVTIEGGDSREIADTVRKEVEKELEDATTSDRERKREIQKEVERLFKQMGRGRGV